MRLKTLLKHIDGCQVKGSKDTTITGICSNSKRVSPGNLFVARRGQTFDGHAFIPEAISAGASAVLTDIYDPSLKNIVQVIHPDVNAMESEIASTFYGHPSEKLMTVGVTGTNGKTTTTYILRHLLTELGSSCGMLGSIEYFTGTHTYQATHTTADVTTNHKHMKEMVQAGCKSVAMEVTSHALDQGRVDRVSFEVAVFTNLTQDHLDYHKDMESYKAAKAKLFKMVKPDSACPFNKAVVVNSDDPVHQEMIEGCQVDVITYGIDKPADVRARDISLSLEGTTFTVEAKGHGEVMVSVPLIGRHNVYNVLASVGVALSQGHALTKVVEALATTPPVPGRLEPVENDRGIKLFVDYSHTDDALKNVLTCLGQLKSRRIVTVFGCGGDRDRTKRPLMAQAAEEGSDVVIVTSDNPRTEDPATICDEVAAGLKGKDHELIVDRRGAIERAIEMAEKDDIVLIAGKGHETYQIIGNQVIEFDDRLVAKEACEKNSLIC